MFGGNEEQIGYSAEIKPSVPVAKSLYDLDYLIQDWHGMEAAQEDVYRYYEQIKQSPRQVFQMLGFLEPMLLSSHHYQEDRELAKDVLRKLYTDQSSFFIRKRIENILDDRPDHDQIDRYNDSNLSDVYNIAPVFNQPWGQSRLRVENEAVAKKLSAVSAISNRFGVVYLRENEQGKDRFFNRHSDIIGFFRLVKPQSDQNEACEAEPIATLDILREEGLKVNDGNLLEINNLANNYLEMISPTVRAMIEDSLGIELGSYSIRLQIQLLNFLIDRDEAAVDQVKKFTEKYGESGLRTFLACEYGMSFGQKILELGEKLPIEQASVLFDRYSDLVKKADSLGNLFEQSGLLNNEAEKDGKQLSLDLQDAVLLRSKDILMAAGERLIQEDGPLEKPMGEVTGTFEALSLYLDTISVLADSNNKPEGLVVDALPDRADAPDTYFYKVEDVRTGFDYRLKIFVRPLADRRGQARVNFELIFDTDKPNIKLKEAFRQTTVYWPDTRKKKIREDSLLRIGLDLETKSAEPTLSLDVGRSQLSDNEIERTGDPLGNMLDAYDNDSGHHTTKTFSTTFADPAKFERISRRFQSYLEQARG